VRKLCICIRERRGRKRVDIPTEERESVEVWAENRERLCIKVYTRKREMQHRHAYVKERKI